MRKNFIVSIAIAILLSIVQIPQLVFADDQFDDENVTDASTVPVFFAKEKSVFGDIGYFGPGGLSLGVGVRYWFASLELGLSGFAKSIPNYSMYSSEVQIYPTQPLPNGYEEDKYSKIIVTGDLAFYLDRLDPFIIFASVGFYSQQDSILAKNIQTGDRYYYKYYNTSGASFGLGVNYVYSDQFQIGLGYHTKRGVFARVTYYWF
ncbi:MAG: hypothetical protein ABFD61_03895 [Chloroherpetonaceae bacterium]